MPLYFGDKPEVKLTAQLRKKRAKFQPLFTALRRLKSQWGLDAEGISLAIDTDRTQLAENVSGSFSPGKNRITLSLPTAESLTSMVSTSKNKFKFAGRDVESYMQSVLRHEFAHAVQLNRERRTGQRDTQVDQPGARTYGGETPHGLLWNKLNESLQGSGAEADRPYIGLPPEIAQLLFTRGRQGF